MVDTKFQKREAEWDKVHAKLVKSGMSPRDAYVEANKLELKEQNKKVVKNFLNM